MTRPKPPRVLESYDPDFGFIVLGTHDPNLAREVLAAELAEEYEDEHGAPLGEVLDDECRDPRPVWIRFVPALPGSWAEEEGYAWWIDYTQPNARGATRAVEWVRA